VRSALSMFRRKVTVPIAMLHILTTEDDQAGLEFLHIGRAIAATNPSRQFGEQVLIAGYPQEMQQVREAFSQQRDMRAHHEACLR